jgi:hypothetical protein
VTSHKKVSEVEAGLAKITVEQVAEAVHGVVGISSV